MEIKK